MKTIDLANAAHEVAGANLTYDVGTYRYRVVLPVKAPVISCSPLSGGRATISFGSYARTNVVLTGPATTIESIFLAIGGRPTSA